MAENVAGAVLAGQNNTIRIGIADAGVRIYGSNLLIVADSVQTALIAKDDTIAVTAKGEATANLLSNDLVQGRTGVHITHLNDKAVQVGQTITLGTGDQPRLNADGSVTVLAATAGSAVSFSYTITDAKGTADTAFVTLLTLRPSMAPLATTRCMWAIPTPRAT